MSKLVTRGYITEIVILILTSIFSVTKVIEGVWMVFDATVRRLNIPCGIKVYVAINGQFFIMMVGPKTHLVNIDSGEMFYHF